MRIVSRRMVASTTSLLCSFWDGSFSLVRSKLRCKFCMLLCGIHTWPNLENASGERGTEFSFTNSGRSNLYRCAPVTTWAVLSGNYKARWPFKEPFLSDADRKSAAAGNTRAVSTRYRRRSFPKWLIRVRVVLHVRVSIPFNICRSIEKLHLPFFIPWPYVVTLPNYFQSLQTLKN